MNRKYLFGSVSGKAFFPMTIFVFMLSFHVKAGSESDKKSGVSSDDESIFQSILNIIVVPEKELIVMQWKNLNSEDHLIVLTDLSGKEINKTTLYQGSTIAFFETQTLYDGDYMINISSDNSILRKKITIKK